MVSSFKQGGNGFYSGLVGGVSRSTFVTLLSCNVVILSEKYVGKEKCEFS